MKTQSVIIVHPQTAEQTKALKAFMQAQKIKFEVSKEEANSPEFEEKIIESKKQIARGEFTDVEQKDILNFIDSLIQNRKDSENSKEEISITPYKTEVLEGLKEAVEEINLIKAGEKKAQPLSEFLHDL